MKKVLDVGLVIGGIILAIILFIIISIVRTYNDLVSYREDIESKYADISVQLERRVDLIPNLVNSVKGYMKHEKDVIDSVTDARTKLVNANSTEDEANANQELTNALNNLFVIVENYPELKSNTNFIQLQDELAGTENRIAVVRTKYNDSVKAYNKELKKFPQNIIADMFKFEDKEYFEAKETASEVPNVSFE